MFDEINRHTIQPPKNLDEISQIEARTLNPAFDRLPAERERKKKAAAF